MATNAVVWRSPFSIPKFAVELAQIIAALVVLAVYGKAKLDWPLIVLAMFIAFFSQIRLLLEGLTTLISKSAGVEIEIAGQKIKLNFAEASNLLQKMADDIKIMIGGLTEDQRKLFLCIAKDPTLQGEIGDPPFEFKRKKAPTILHNDLRALRGRHLVRPSGGGPWREHKSPELTPFGKLVIASPSFEGKGCDANGGTPTWFDREP
jgi:hypothetical protein